MTDATRTDDAGVTPSELMIAAAARQLAGARNVFVGIGLPNVAANLARLTFAPGLELVYEAGAYGARPARLPLSIGDPALVTDTAATMSMSELFSLYLQAGRIDVGFLGASQIDRCGNLNTTVIGDYRHPSVRLPGSGGACEIALNARRVVVVMHQDRRSFVERVDFITSPGTRVGAVVTQLAVYRMHDGELELSVLQPGVEETDVDEASGWRIRRADVVTVLAPPTADELELMRSGLLQQIG